VEPASFSTKASTNKANVETDLKTTSVMEDGGTLDSISASTISSGTQNSFTTSPAQSSVDTTTAEFSFTTANDGYVYASCASSENSAITVRQVNSGLDAESNNAPSGSAQATSATQGTVTVDGLTAGSTYYCYFTACDESTTNPTCQTVGTDGLPQIQITTSGGDSTGTIIQESEDCSQNYAPLYLMTVVSGVGVVLVVLLLIVGRKLQHSEAHQAVPDTGKSKGNAEEKPLEGEKVSSGNAQNSDTSKKQQFLLNHLILGIFKASNQLRIIRLVCIVSELLILGCLIGAFTVAFQETDSEDKQEEDFGGAEIGIMFLGIAITTIILGVVEIIMKVCNSKNTRLGVLTGMLVLACLSFAMTGYMCSEFCEVWSLLWTYSYLLGIALEILLSQPIRALVITFTKSLN